MTPTIGYRVVGLEGPVLLGVLTGVLSAVPAIGTAIVWVPMGAWLLMTGSVWKGILLLLWGFLLVHPIDNVLRPWLISSVTRVPFLLVMFGAIGGLTAFGLVGVFVGPVLLVKTEGTYRRPIVLAALDPNHTYSKPAKLDDEILSAGSAVTQALHGSLHAVHAYIPVPTAAVAYGAVDAKSLAQLEAQAAIEAKRGLDRALRSAKIPDRRRYLVGRHPIDAIEQTAREIHSAIVVMGAVSRSGLQRLFIGNTAESVLDRLACDVLIVKPAHFTKRVPRARRGVKLVSVATVPGLY